MIPVLCYHYFGIDRSIQPGIKSEDLAYITPIAEFEKTLSRLKLSGYEFCTIMQQTESASKRCVITIDDAHRSVLTHVFPVLKKHSISAVLFVVPTWVGREGYLNWAEIQMLADNGWEIGIHGHTHRRLTALGDSEIIQELSEARQALKTHLNLPKKTGLHEQSPSLAVPMGGISDRVERLARAQGFSYILNSHFGIWNGRSERCIPRIVVKESYDSADEVSSLIEGGFTMRRTELQMRSTVKRLRDQMIEWKQGRF